MVEGFLVGNGVGFRIGLLVDVGNLVEDLRVGIMVGALVIGSSKTLDGVGNRVKTSEACRRLRDSRSAAAAHASDNSNRIVILSIPKTNNIDSTPCWAGTVSCLRRKWEKSPETIK